ncbi:MAG: hypothetical protein ACXVJW_08770 [Acidimicrobiia bacterium]
MKHKKKIIVSAVLVGALAVAGIGYAFWTTGGAGTGSGSTGTTTDNLVIHGTSTPALTPGNSATVSFTADNPSAFPQSISNIHLVSVEAYDTAAHATAGGPTGLVALCGGANSGVVDNTGPGSDFWMVDVAVNPSTDGHLAANAVGQVLTTTGTLHMNDLSAQNQDTCKGTFLRLDLTSS